MLKHLADLTHMFLFGLGKIKNAIQDQEHKDIQHFMMNDADQGPKVGRCIGQPKS